MQVSPSLADFMDRLNEGPRGPEDALAAIAQCAAESATVLDLQQMCLTDEDLEVIAPKLETVASHVTKLNLFMNEISILPASISALCGLEVLLAGCNPLEGISPELLAGLPKLKSLDIGFSEVLAELPDAFDKVASLRVLLAGNGRLTSLPPSLFKCQKLEEVQLYGNSLKEISEDLGNLHNLRILNVGRNQLAKLPESIGKCTALETLHVYENCLSALPRGVANLKQLHTLNTLSNEALPVPPREVRCLADAKSTAAFFASVEIKQC